MKLAPQELRTYSLTAVTAGRYPFFRVAENAELLIETIENYRAKGNFEIYTFVVMPDHLHLLLTPAPHVPVEKVMQLIKGGFSFRLKSKRDVWDRGFFDRRVKDGVDFDICKRYIEQNPVRGRLAVCAKDYLYSALRFPERMSPKPKWFCDEGQG